MIHECIEANREKFARYAKIATVIGWVVLVVSAVIMLPTIFQFSRIVGRWNIFKCLLFLIRTISPAFYGMVFLLLGQFLKCELGSEERPGWFFRNGSVILRAYAAVFIGIIIFQYIDIIFSLVENNGPLGHIFLSLVTPNAMIILTIAKVFLLWGLAGAVKLMLEEIRKKDGMGHLNA